MRPFISSQNSQVAMSHSLALCAALFGVATLAAPSVSPLSVPNAYVVNGLAALGDSYITQSGAGILFAGPPSNGSCSIFEQDSPFLVLNDRRLVYNSTTDARDFYPVMCSSSTTRQLPTQAAGVGNDTNMALLTIGANDIGLAGLLDSCVYGFYPNSGVTCDQAEIRVRSVLKSSAFLDRLTTGISAIYAQSPHANVYIVGYPEFFNAGTTQCNTACFNVLDSSCPSNFLLTTKKRTTINNIIDSLNGVLAKAVDSMHGRVTGSIQYLNINPGFNGHRFCEDGVKEPDYNNANAYLFPFTYFARPWLKQYNTSVCGDYNTLFNGEIGDMFACGVYERGDTSQLNQATQYSSTQFPDPKTNSGKFSAPDYFNRIFHPTTAATQYIHQAIMNRYLNGK